jgi:serine/threonine protein kinase/tetratricopeptide (TPR) repeat protein
VADPAPAFEIMFPDELERGASIGRYLVIGLLGRGGMGEVYAAYDPELDRKIALKLLRTHTSAGVDPSEGRARLLREAQAIARLSDPNVVVVFDVGAFGDRVFLAMEFVDGSTLGYWLQAQTPPASWREILAKFTAAGRGLACAHRAGVIHRDFKADNVMVGRDGGVRVMDFGLARSIEQASPGAPGSADPARSSGELALRTSGAGRVTADRPSTRPGAAPAPTSDSPPSADPDPATGGGRPATAALEPSRPAGSGPSGSGLVVSAAVQSGAAGHPTRVLSRTEASSSDPASAPSALDSPLTLSGAMMGTPAYMAPEQFRGGKVDARADQFSFCVALYEALYGKRPFEGRSLDELTRNVIAGRVRAAPANTRVPRWLRRTLLRGLRVEPVDRHASMEALIEALGRDPARARRRWASATAVVGVVAALGMGLGRAQRQQRTRCLGAEAKLAGVWELPVDKVLSPRQEAIRQAFVRTGKRYAAESFAAVKSALDRYVVTWTTMARESCEATNLRGEQSPEVLDLRTSCLDEHFAEVRALTNLLVSADGELVTKSVEAVQTIRPVEQCADIAALRAVVRPPDDPAVRRTVADLRDRLAVVKAEATAGHLKDSRTKLSVLIEEARRTKYDPIIAESLSQLGWVQLETGEPVPAEKSYEEAVILAEGARADEVVVDAETFLIYSVGSSQGRYADGELWARHAGAVLRRLGPGHEVLAGWRANNLGTLYEREGRYAEALAMDLESLRLKQSALGPDHFDVAISEGNVALALFQLGRTDEAIVRGEHAIHVLSAALGPDHPKLGLHLLNVAEFHDARGDFAQARSFGERSLAILEREVDPDHPLLAYPLAAIGQGCIGQGQPAAAIPVLERALRIRESRDPDPVRLGETRFLLARALADTGGGPERSLSLARQARSELQGTHGATTPEVVEAWIQAHRSRPGVPISMR